MNFKLDDFKIDFIKHPAQVKGGGGLTYSDSCTDGDEGCCDSDQAVDDACICLPPLT